ncbi:TetR/AcrR family transcriptional regulator [Saccharothrix algeriensis]|uniref:AcrR family transcriptional regulator n=1 Tax=Saccharothrix algeriensis TaxID=173560 RepID=A0A8T8I513_9PSEU|nr:TetR/AcrR family transcriptional regulator [Saccharothrix algeriensis]MBM7812240.1 AcrR family transcriptional regulator [Saccharothrix algeriensis]QTR05857.1 TetR/AcrR family transcriptional regulator [Saccharothrix algeriensis]
MPPDAARRSDRSRRAILAAALELLEERGYAKVTVEAVAARAGVGKQTIYRWWQAKGPLLFDAFIESRAVGWEVRPWGELGADLKLELREAIAEVGERRFDQVCRALVHEARTDLVALLLTPRRVVLEQRLAAAQRDGDVRGDVDVAAAAELLLGPVYQRWLLRTGPLTGAFSDRVVDLALRALLG